MRKKLEVLILDDNEIIGDCIRKRIFKANESNFSFTKLEIIPHYFYIDLENIQQSIDKISSEIIVKKIDVLLLDRGFFKIVDPSTDSTYRNLSSKYLYCKKDDQGRQIEEILGLIPKEKFKNISGVIVYTYDSGPWYIEPAQIKQSIKELLPEKFDKNAIDVVMTNTEVYSLANLKLYNQREVKDFPELKSIGNKSEFMLYGLFMGEILYHRIVSLIEKKREKVLENKKTKIQRNVIFLFIIFTALNLGAEALYSLLSMNLGNDYLLFFMSAGFALLLPILILILKPEWIINFEE